MSDPAPIQRTIADRKVLIVDDNFVNREVALEAFEFAGARASTAESGEVALDMLRAETFDLVLLDLFMPGIDGFEVGVELRRISPETPIVVFSAADDAGCERANGLFSPEGFVSKPVDLDALVSQAEHALR